MVLHTFECLVGWLVGYLVGGSFVGSCLTFFVCDIAKDVYLDPHPQFSLFGSGTYRV